MSSVWTYRANQETPSWAGEWRDRTGTLIDLSAHTFVAKLVDKSTGSTLLTKSTGITGAATSPNIVVAWAAGELNIIPVGRDRVSCRLHITATLSGNDRVYAPGNEPIIDILPAA